MGNFGFLLPTLVYTYLGASAKQLFALFNQAPSSDGDMPRTPEQQKVHDLQVMLLIAGIVLMVGVITLIGCITKRELDKMIKEGEMEGLKEAGKSQPGWSEVEMSVGQVKKESKHK